MVRAEGDSARSIYVEILIRGTLDELWRLTQRPEFHQRWDLRFSEIEYLPRPDESLPQRFLYVTRVGFGLAIRGLGESTGGREAEGRTRTSALKFWSEDPKSLIREGSGFWRYEPTADGIRFLTRYGYTTRFGLGGRVLDTLFRPLIGWATAWSFDRLRLWIEKGIDPTVSLQRWLLDLVTRVPMAFVFVYHGVVPKLIYRSPDEIRLLTGAGLPLADARQVLPLIGIAEVALGAALLAGWSARELYAVIMLLMGAATVGVAIISPDLLTAAFDPITLNVSVAALAAVGLIAGRDVPSASRCRRAPLREPE